MHAGVNNVGIQLHQQFPANIIISTVVHETLLLSGNLGRVARQYSTTVSLTQRFLILGSIKMRLINTSWTRILWRSTCIVCGLAFSSWGTQKLSFVRRFTNTCVKKHVIEIPMFFCIIRSCVLLIYLASSSTIVLIGGIWGQAYGLMDLCMCVWEMYI